MTGLFDLFGSSNGGTMTSIGAGGITNVPSNDLLKTILPTVVTTAGGVASSIWGKPTNNVTNIYSSSGVNSAVGNPFGWIKANPITVIVIVLVVFIFWKPIKRLFGRR